MLEYRIRVINALGLHARAAAKLVKTARRFRSRIMLTNVRSGESANAKSILSLLYIAASLGAEIVLTAEGDDEAEAIEAVVNLFSSGFGEK
ncbi:MAG: HPr family phosphocarrier protein [Pyrinomonadaceae bacterium]